MIKTSGATITHTGWDMVEAERADVHAFLSSLVPSQWDVPSVCEGWRVRDVAAHMLVDEPLRELGVPRAVMKAIGFRMSVHRINAWWIERNYSRDPTSIVQAFDGPFVPGGISKKLGPSGVLRGLVIHHQDMRRSLGVPRTVPTDRVVRVLERALTQEGSRNLGSYERGVGLRLQADDIEWSSGSGPLVHGTIEALLMSIAGRPCALAELSGDGLEVLEPED